MVSVTNTTPPDGPINVDHARVLRMARRYTRCPHRAADIAQEALLKAWKHREKQNGPFEPWLAGIVRNTARSMYRRNRRYVELESEPATPEAEEASLQIRIPLDRYGGSYQAMLDLIVEGVSIKAAGRRLGITYARAKRLHRNVMDCLERDVTICNT